MLKKLKSLFDEHRKKAFVTCDETCFCWDVENFLTSQKEAAQQPRAADEGDSSGEDDETNPYLLPAVYVARRECGCVVGLATDLRDKSTGEAVAEFIADGLTVDRFELHVYTEEICKEETFMNCPHCMAKSNKCWVCGKPWSEHRTNRVGHEVCP